MNPVNRQVIRLAPDALVFINQSLYTPVCNNSSSSGSFIPSVSSISVTLGIDSIGSASITLEEPRTRPNSFFRDGFCVIHAMQEVKIYMRGRWKIEGENRYYPVFWGLITSVSVSEGVPERIISVECSGILEWWQICKVSLNPSVVDSMFDPSKQATARTNIFYNLNSYQIIAALAYLSSGDNFYVSDLWGYAQNDFTKQTITENQDRTTQIRSYWFNRFKDIANNLVMFGATGINRLRVKKIDVPQDFLKRTDFWDTLSNYIEFVVDDDINNITMSSSNENSNRFDFIESFRPYSGVSTPDAYSTQQMTKLDIANQIKNSIGYEFFMDSTGQLIFKPPMFNLNTKDFGPIFRIDPIDIFNYSISENSDIIVTRTEVSGSTSDIITVGDTPSSIPVKGIWRDPYLEMIYGFRPSSPIVANWCRNPLACQYYAMDQLSLMNSNAKTINATIALRPEMRLGLPYYFSEIDTYAYLTGLTHSITFGEGGPKTSCQFNALRSKFGKLTKQYSNNRDFNINPAKYQVMTFIKTIDKNLKQTPPQDIGQTLESFYPVMPPLGVTQQDTRKDIVVNSTDNLIPFERELINVSVPNSSGLLQEQESEKIPSDITDAINSRNDKINEDSNIGKTNIFKDDRFEFIVNKNYSSIKQGYWIGPTDADGYIIGISNRGEIRDWFQLLSDGEGYELVGVFPYGRGQSISTKKFYLSFETISEEQSILISGVSIDSINKAMKVVVDNNTNINSSLYSASKGETGNFDVAVSSVSSNSSECLPSITDEITRFYNLPVRDDSK